MSGHSKWSKIKRKKGAKDTQRGALFTKLGKAITIAATEGGGDPDMNFTLRLAVDSAKKANMPLANIERAIKKGSGEGGEGGSITKMIYEGTGPAGSSFVVRCSTDNTNRTVSEVRKIFDSAGGSMGTSGSQMWLFEEKGVITVKAQKLVKAEKFGKEDTYEDVDIDELEMELMDVEGIAEIERMEDNELELYTSMGDFANVHKALGTTGINIVEAGLQYVPKDTLDVPENIQERVIKMMTEMDEHDDVDSVYTNVNL